MTFDHLASGVTMELFSRMRSAQQSNNYGIIPCLHFWDLTLTPQLSALDRSSLHPLLLHGLTIEPLHDLLMPMFDYAAT